MKRILQLALFGLALIPSLVLAARPSITNLQQQINQLQAQINQLSSDNAQQDIRISELESNTRTVITDLNNKLVGTMLDQDNNTDDREVYSAFKAEGRTFRLVVSNRSPSPPFWGTQLYFDQLGCSGNIYMKPHDPDSLTEWGSAYDGKAYIVDDPTIPFGDPRLVSVTYYSSAVSDGRGCVDIPQGNVRDLTPARPVMDTTQFTPPFSIHVLP